MHFITLLPLGLAGLASAQMSLTQVLASQNSTLSTLNSLLATQPQLAAMLASAKDITLLAPSNAAFAKFVEEPANQMAASDPATLMGVLQYHVLQTTVPASGFTTTMQFLPTMLGATTSNSSMNTMNMTTMMSDVTGGQVVGGVVMGEKVELMSGLKSMSTVQTADIMFTGGVMHIIDTVLTVPSPPSTSALDSQLTALAGALKSANLLTAVDDLKDVTIFAPSNKAFQNIGSATPMLTEQQLSGILEYHVINGTVGYSSLLTTGLANESFPTLAGGNVMVEAVNGKVFINSAMVTITDIIVSNGVLHVIDNVLNPANSTAMPNPTATQQAVAFAGAAAASNVPFTSGIIAPTTAASASTSKAGAGRARESGVGAVGVVALFGMMGAAIL
ncbi:Fasciclin-like arabinogalactan protein [Lachnellula suecica]|uniref:Fasciclin-like arabinogalactan protein n=1 Tax=Lachnellula suecica TaxID=602035 RepID=A0A8T9CIR9_9HELO|nr:Fasciclin-like arabinogalactan protein [Lachnellula suecica]